MYASELFEQNKPRVVVTYPGRFQPFHQGHAGVFAQLQKQFGADNVFVVTSNDTSSAKSPFNFSDKYQLITAAGVPANHIVQTNKMYILPDGFDPRRTVFVTAVGAPDKDRLNPDTYTKRDQKDKDGNVTKPAGSPSYYRTWDAKQAPVTADQHGYVVVIPEIKKSVVINKKSYDASHGTEVRNLWNMVRDNHKAREEFLQQLYKNAHRDLIPIFNKISEPINEQDDSKKADLAKMLGFPLKLDLGNVADKPVTLGVQRPANKELGKSLQPALTVGDKEGPYAQLTPKGVVLGYKKTFEDEQNVAEGSLDEFAAGGGGNIPRGPKTPNRGPWDDNGEDPYELRRYSRSIDFFDQFDSDGVDKQNFDKATGEYEGYYFDRDAASGITQIAYFKFDDPTKIGDNDPGVGWYYEPIDEGVAEGYSLGKVLTLPELLEQIKHILSAKHPGIGWRMTMPAENTFLFSAQNDYDVWSMLVVEAGGDDWVAVGHGMVDPDGKPIIFDRQQLPMTLASASEIADEAIQTYHDIDLSDYADDEDYNKGVAEGFNSKQEVIDYFVKQGKTAAQGAAAWERGYRGPQPKSKPHQPPKAPNPQQRYWWQDRDDVNEEAAGVGVVAKNKKMAKDPRYSMSMTKDVKPSTPKNMLRAFRLAETWAQRRRIAETDEGISKAQMMSVIKKFLPLAMQELKINKLPHIVLQPEIEAHDGQATFGRFVNEEEKIYLGLANRHPVDILRTLAHELVHYKQYEDGKMYPGAGETGSPIENQAHMVAGVIMRHFNKKYPNAMKLQQLELGK